VNKDLKNACRSTRDMDEYLEVRSSQEIIDDIKESANQETLRDQFAMHALGSIPLRSWDHIADGDAAIIAAWAKCAYAVADAMLAKRALAVPPADRGGEA